MDQDKMIYRSVPTEARTTNDGKVGITGHFSTTNDPYYIREYGEEFMEQIETGAFTETLRNDRISVLFEHGYDPQIGRKPIGTPTVLEEDARGARYDADLYVESSYVRDILPAIRNGDFGTSFGFRVEDEDWDYKPERTAKNPNGIPVRTIKKLRVSEFSVVLNPANPSADVKVRSLTDYVTELRGENTHTEEPAVATEDGVTEASETNDVREARDEAVSVEPEAPEVKEEAADDEVPVKSESRKEGDSVMEKMTVEERQARVDVIQERLESLATDYDGEELPSENQAEWDELVAERAKHERAIIATEERRKVVARNGREEGTVERTREAPAVHVQPDNLHDVTSLRSMSPEDRERKSYDNARRILDRTDFLRSDEAADKNRDHITKMLNSDYADKAVLSQKIMRSSHPRYREDFNAWLNSGGMHVRAAMALGADASGGYMVPFDLDPTWILTSDGAINPLREVARVEKISGTHLQLVTTAGVTVHRDGEAAAVQDGNGTLAGPEYNAGRVSGYLPFSFEIDDAASGLQGQLTAALAEAKAEEEASIFVTGAGNGLTGIQGLNQLATLNGGASALDVDTFSSEDIYALDNDLAPRHRRGASFLANKPTQNAIRALSSDADGSDLWVRLGDGLPPQLIGYSIREMSELESQSDGTNPFLVLGDFKKYLIVDRIGMVVQVDNMVKKAVSNGGGYDVMPSGQRAIVAYWWNGGGFVDPNAFRALVDDGI